MRKSSESLRCCFCGDGTAGVEPQDYVEIEVTFPASSGTMAQYFGAHVQCFDSATAEGFRVEVPPIEG